jgi:hypothetical protein
MRQMPAVEAWLAAEGTADEGNDFYLCVITIVHYSSKSS